MACGALGWLILVNLCRGWERDDLGAVLSTDVGSFNPVEINKI